MKGYELRLPPSSVRLGWGGVGERRVERQRTETTIYSLSDIAPSRSGERRRTDRMMTLYRVGSLAVDERSELCLIKNICPNGMMVRTYCSVSEGSRVTIELKCGQPISGRVSWARDAHAGITFDQAIDVIDILATSMNGPRPRMPRIQVGGFLTLREGAFSYRVQLCDISQGGLKIRSEKGLVIDSHVVVSIQRIAPQPSVVRWIDGHYMGITFNRMLALPVLVDWLRDQRDSLQSVRAVTLQSLGQG